MEQPLSLASYLWLQLGLKMCTVHGQPDMIMIFIVNKTHHKLGNNHSHKLSY